MISTLACISNIHSIGENIVSDVLHLKAFVSDIALVCLRIVNKCGIVDTIRLIKLRHAAYAAMTRVTNTASLYSVIYFVKTGECMHIIKTVEGGLQRVCALILVAFHIFIVLTKQYLLTERDFNKNLPNTLQLRN